MLRLKAKYFSLYFVLVPLDFFHRRGSCFAAQFPFQRLNPWGEGWGAGRRSVGWGMGEREEGDCQSAPDSLKRFITEIDSGNISPRRFIRISFIF